MLLHRRGSSFPKGWKRCARWFTVWLTSSRTTARKEEINSRSVSTFHLHGNSNRTASKNISRVSTATPTQQVQDLHVPRHETEGRLSTRSKLHLRPLSGRTGKVSVVFFFAQYKPLAYISISITFCSLTPGTAR